jgi:hypothetical protein
VYNSIGSLVFQVSGYNNNDIRFEGIANQSVQGSNQLISGTYYYYIDVAGQRRISGYFTLLR